MCMTVCVMFVTARPAVPMAYSCRHVLHDDDDDAICICCMHTQLQKPFTIFSAHDKHMFVG